MVCVMRMKSPVVPIWMPLNYDDTATDDDGSCAYPASSVFDIIASSEVHTVLESLVHSGRIGQHPHF